MALALHHRPHPPTVSARPFVTFAGGLTLVAVLHGTHLPWPAALVALCSWCAVAAVGSGPLGFVANALLVAALANGFIENEYGALTWHGLQDVVLVLVLIACSATGALAGRHHSRHAHPTSTSTSEQKEQ